MISTFLRARACLKFGLTCTAMAVLIALIGAGRATADAQQVRVELAAPVPETVWRHADEGAPCVPNDYADVPVRSFLVKGAASGTPVVRGATPADLSAVQLLELGIGILRRWRPAFSGISAMTWSG